MADDMATDVESDMDNDVDCMDDMSSYVACPYKVFVTRAIK